MSRRPGPPDEVYFPVVPMLDMSFQLLAFFIMTFQPPSGETRIDLVLPAAPVALPRGRPAAADAPDEVGLETDLVVEATAGPGGELARLSLANATLDTPGALRDRLARYVAVVAPRPVRVVLRADDALRYEVGARLIAACTSAGVGSVRLDGPGR